MINIFMGEYRFLSNFHEVPILYEGITYPTTEHAYQARKSLVQKVRKIFSKLEKPLDAQILGQHIQLRSGWEKDKLGVMESVIRIKFNQEPLKSKLLDTGVEQLIEGNYWHDTFWGVCNGIGENHLGKILMKIRDELRK